jgi:hypothetical protein
MMMRHVCAAVAALALVFATGCSCCKHNRSAACCPAPPAPCCGDTAPVVPVPSPAPQQSFFVQPGH